MQYAQIWLYLVIGSTPTIAIAIVAWGVGRAAAIRARKWRATSMTAFRQPECRERAKSTNLGSGGGGRSTRFVRNRAISVRKAFSVVGSKSLNKLNFVNDEIIESRLHVPSLLHIYIGRYFFKSNFSSLLVEKQQTFLRFRFFLGSFEHSHIFAVGRYSNLIRKHFYFREF